MSVRKLSYGAAVLFTLSTTFGCSGDLSHTISLDKATLQSKLESYFPMSTDDAESDEKKPVSVELKEPEVILEQGSDQLGLRLKVVAEPADEVASKLPEKPPVGPPGGGPPGGGPPLPGGGSKPSPPEAKEPPKKLNGTVGVVGKISYKPEDGSFYFREPKISDLKFDDLPPHLDKPVRKAAEAVMTVYLEKNAIYKLSDDDLKGSAAKALLKSVSVKDGKLDIVIGW